MSTYAEKILDLVKRRPGSNTVAISDILNIGINVVERELNVLSAAGQVVGESITGTNGCPTMSWREVSTLKWQAPEGATVIVKNEEVGAPSPTSIGNGRLPGLHAVNAVKYLQQHASATNDDLQRVLGIDYLPTAALKKAVKAGWLAYVNQTWSLGKVDIPVASPAGPMAIKRRAVSTLQGVDIDGAHVQQTPVAHVSPVTPHDDVHTPSHYTKGGMDVIDILRAKLTPEEFRGFCKGNVIKYTLRAELKDGAKDYAKGSVYAGWLAQIAKPTV